jgi:hypothetical protein
MYNLLAAKLQKMSWKYQLFDFGGTRKNQGLRISNLLIFLKAIINSSQHPFCSLKIGAKNTIFVAIFVNYLQKKENSLEMWRIRKSKKMPKSNKWLAFKVLFYFDNDTTSTKIYFIQLPMVISCHSGYASNIFQEEAFLNLNSLTSNWKIYENYSFIQFIFTFYQKNCLWKNIV